MLVSIVSADKILYFRHVYLHEFSENKAVLLNINAISSAQVRHTNRTNSSIFLSILFILLQFCYSTMRGTLITTIVCATAILSAFALVATPRPRQKLNDPSNQSLSIRDPGTVSTFLYKRWIWAWLGAELLWKGLSVATTIWGAGCTIAGVTKCKLFVFFEVENDLNYLNSNKR